MSRSSIIQRGLVHSGRLARLTVEIRDVPGELARTSNLIGETGANIVQVNHLTQDAPEGDFILTTRVLADADENFQQAGIFLVLDGVNYFSIQQAHVPFPLPDLCRWLAAPL